MTSFDVAIVGAGPYGLAAAAHLRSAGVPIRVFGESMEFWQRQMPIGMCLRSSWDASHIADPRAALTLDRFVEVRGRRLATPLPLADFVDYGQWFQRKVVPDLDCRRVVRVEPQSIGFRLGLADGDTILAKRVVIATGLAQFAHWPAQFAGLPRFLVSHSADERDLQRFAGQQVIVVGAGQSAVESAALLAEGGADVELILRAPHVRWLGRTAGFRRLGVTRRLLYHPTDVGPPGLSQIVARPDLFRRLPRTLQDSLAYRAIRPAASDWLRARVVGVRQTIGQPISSAISTDSGITLTLGDRTRRRADHVLLATGYRVDLARYSYLPPELVQALDARDGYPDLTFGFESSVQGMHFIGATAARSFGPLMRFVSGTDYTARNLTRRLLATFEPTLTGLPRDRQRHSARV